MSEKIIIDHLRSPAGGHGFRKGWWIVRYQGREYKVFASIPHAASFETQDRLVREAARAAIAKAMEGE